MLDLGTSFLASVARDPDALAIVDGDVRLTYARLVPAHLGAWSRASTRSGSSPAITSSPCCRTAGRPRRLHWACQFAGIIITPVNWRAKRDEIDFYLRGRRGQGARLRGRVRRSRCRIGDRRRRCRGSRSTRRSASDDRICRAGVARRRRDAAPRVDAEAWSLMLYTSGTTARPKGVPRRQRAERAAALAHVAQNLYAHGERTLGVMPLYHTMGVRSLLAMSLIGGTFVCLRRFDVARRARS